MNTDVIFSKKTDEWATPAEFYIPLNEEFGFDLDPCSTKENHKCDLYYTQEDDGLQKDWGGHTVFVNPPYSNLKQWAHKCWLEHYKENTTIVLFVPARTDTIWFHTWVLPFAEIRFIKGRVRFVGGKNKAPFASILAIYRSPEQKG